MCHNLINYDLLFTQLFAVLLYLNTRTQHLEKTLINEGLISIVTILELFLIYPLVKQMLIGVLCAHLSTWYSDSLALQCLWLAFEPLTL